ncbi:MAG: LuxR family transcriptional regulator [Microvirga sp.]|jgi:DNA-binding CsgD family transcriptional regulator|nr:LuxR family transcriptional regulator [Microvirga sp.]
MVESDELSRLIGHVYDASLDPSLWVNVLEHTCGFIGGATASIISHDVKRRNASFHFTWNDNPEYTRTYLQHYAKINPVIVPATLNTQVDQVSTYLDFISEEEYRQTKLYQEWTQPQGYLDAVQATLDKSSTSYSAVASIYSEKRSPVSAQARHRMRLLAPHFRRAVTIGKVIDLHKVESASLADTLDGIAAALFLLDGAGRLMLTNAAAKTMVSEASVVRSAGGKLMLTDAQAEHSLHDYLANATQQINGLDIPILADAGERLVAHILPLTSGARRKAVVAYSAVAAVFIRRAAMHGPHPFEALSRAFSLTAGEMRVLMTIVEVGGVPEVSRVLGLSELTVRTHLRNVFSKTGCSRQADLVKLVASYMSPLATAGGTETRHRG